MHTCSFSLCLINSLSCLVIRDTDWHLNLPVHLPQVPPWTYCIITHLYTHTCERLCHDQQVKITIISVWHLRRKYVPPHTSDCSRRGFNATRARSIIRVQSYVRTYGKTTNSQARSSLTQKSKTTIDDDAKCCFVINIWRHKSSPQIISKPRDVRPLSL